jgi:S1-C subfamily serine protease
MPSDETGQGLRTVSGPGRTEAGGTEADGTEADGTEADRSFAAQPEQGSDGEEGNGRRQGPAIPWDEMPPHWYPGSREPPLWYPPGQGRRPAQAPRPPARAYIVILATLLVFYLVAVGIGVGIGYGVFRSTTSVTTPPVTTPTTSPASSAKAAAVAAKVDPGLVDVDTVLSYQTAAGAGTGMVVTSSGEVFTNNHVIEDETSLHVTDVGNGKTYAATVVGYDVTADIAVLQLKGASNLNTVSFASGPAKIGQAVVAIGNAEGKGGAPTAVTGKINGVGKTITAENELSGTTEHLKGMIETSAPIAEGDSGGPLVNGAGRVLGMITAASSSFAFAHETSKGFAIPVGTAKAIGTAIKLAKPSATIHIGPTAFLGVEVTDVDTTGAVVAAVLPGTAATAMGLDAGDTITAVDGHAIRDPTTLSNVLQLEKPGAIVPISWLDRFGQAHRASVTLRSGPPA